MSMNEPERPQAKTGCLAWCVIGVALVLLLSLMMPSYSLITVTAQQMKACSNARQIIALLLTYADENDGHYPDHGRDLAGLTANRVFRELIKEGLSQDETIFGAPQSPFVPDKDIGTEPGYEQALSPGENHWMMVAGLSNKSPSYYPVVLENAADASWPPKWLPVAPPSWWEKLSGRMTPSRRKPGNSWKGDAILIGYNDASVIVQKLESQAEWRGLPESYLKPKDKEPLPTFQILDVEASK